MGEGEEYGDLILDYDVMDVVKRFVALLSRLWNSKDYDYVASRSS